MWKEWVIDVSTSPPCFCPYDRELGEVVFGMNLVTAKYPGKLVGVIHSGGQEKVNRWCEENPDWHNGFSASADEETPTVDKV